ncbi:MAG: hypothetical protein P8N75_08230 [Ascidiaceihabitans sp.]|nr:hypothetical protein [Ascidiaceihabitans sp.]
MTKRRPNALELRHPFFRPLWRRITLIAVLAGWTVVEATAGNPVWALLMAGIGIYSSYVFFIDFILPDDEKSSSENR